MNDHTEWSKKLSPLPNNINKTFHKARFRVVLNILCVT